MRMQTCTRFPATIFHQNCSDITENTAKFFSLAFFYLSWYNTCRFQYREKSYERKKRRREQIFIKSRPTKSRTFLNWQANRKPKRSLRMQRATRHFLMLPRQSERHAGHPLNWRKMQVLRNTCLAIRFMWATKSTLSTAESLSLYSVSAAKIRKRMGFVSSLFISMHPASISSKIPYLKERSMHKICVRKMHSIDNYTVTEFSFIRWKTLNLQ